MRISKPIILYLPNTLIKELDSYLNKHPPNFRFQRVYFYYLIHHLTVLQIQHKNNECHSLNKTFLKGVTVSNIDRYIKILVNGEFILSTSGYKPGMSSLRYKLNPKLVKGVVQFNLDSNCRLGKRIIKTRYKRKAHYNRLKPHLKLMKDKFMKMELDYKKAKKWIDDNADFPERLPYLTSVHHIEDKRFRYFKRNRTNGRLDTNLTNLKSDLRQFIVGDYVSIDLKNSQPLLLALLIDNIIINNRDTLCSYLRVSTIKKTFGIKPIQKILLFHQKQEKSKMVNLKSFKESTFKGTLYDEFISKYSEGISRKEVKQIMFKVLFSRNVYYAGYKKIIPYESDKQAFRSVYPFVGKVVRFLKRKDHRTLPIYLQKMESYLFIDCIAKELVHNGIVPFTIHDSIIIEQENLMKSIDIINDVFKKQIGEIPSLDIQNLNCTINQEIKIAV